MHSKIAEKVAEIVRDSGGKIVGRTRLQKIAYLLYAAGLDEGFPFAYKHYGPYSEILAVAARDASLLGLINETECGTNWGGSYSVYSASNSSGAASSRQCLAALAANADSVVLELTATAVFLAREGFDDPWAETIRRKPEKANADRIRRAKELFREFSAIETPTRWPDIH
jgi:uncharacterized protein